MPSKTEGNFFSKACSVDGSPVGFCGWTVERNNEHRVEGNDGQANDQANVQANGQANGRPKEEVHKRAMWVPDAIDIDSWITVSKALRVERARILKDLDNICRKLIHAMAGIAKAS